MTTTRLILIIVVSAIAIAFPLAILINHIRKRRLIRAYERAFADSHRKLRRMEIDAITGADNVVPMICKPNPTLKRKGARP